MLLLYTVDLGVQVVTRNKGEVIMFTVGAGARCRAAALHLSDALNLASYCLSPGASACTGIFKIGLVLGRRIWYNGLVAGRKTRHSLEPDWE